MSIELTIETSVAIAVGLIVIAFILCISKQKMLLSRQLQTNKNTNCPVQLMIDDECSNLIEWFKQDTKEKPFLAFGDTITAKSTKEHVKNLPFTDSYKDRFSEDPTSEFYFRRGKITRIQRFTAVATSVDDKCSTNINASSNTSTTNCSDYEIGHIECVFINSPHLYIKDEGKNDNIVGWLYNVYIAPNHRGKGLSKHMVTQAIEHFLEHGIGNIYLAVVKTNEPALKTYKKCGFKIIDEVECDDDVDFVMKYQI